MINDRFRIFCKRLIRERKRSLFTALSIAVLILCVVILASRFDTEISTASILPSLGSRMAGFPKIILWAWERPEELSFIVPQEVGIAFLAKTLYLRGERVIVRPRLQPLNVPRRTALMAVARIESDLSEPPGLLSEQRAKVVSTIAELTRIPTIAAIQVDFDAKVSERAFYRDLLYDLRRRLPESMALSITALASWCIYDNWLSGLPVDEAVPMLFRMGVDHHQVLLHLEAGGYFRPAVCRHSLGISTDEPMPKLPSGRRVYIFHPQAWSPAAARHIIKEVQKCQ